MSFGRSDDPCYRRSFFVCKGDGVQRLEKRDPFPPKNNSFHTFFIGFASRIPFFVSKILKFKKQWRIQGRGPGGPLPPPPPYFGTKLPTKLSPEGPKHFFGRPGPSLSQGLDTALKRPIAAEANNSIRR